MHILLTSLREVARDSHAFRDVPESVGVSPAQDILLTIILYKRPDAKDTDNLLN